MSHLSLDEGEDEPFQPGGPGSVVGCLSCQALEDHQSQVDGGLDLNHLLDVLLQPAEDGEHRLHVLAVEEGLLHHPAARLIVDQLNRRTWKEK